MSHELALQLTLWSAIATMALVLLTVFAFVRRALLWARGNARRAQLRRLLIGPVTPGRDGNLRRALRRRTILRDLELVLPTLDGPGRARALLALRGHGFPDRLRAQATARNTRTRLRVARLIGLVQCRDGIQELAALMTDEHAGIRLAAARSLAQLRNDDAARTLVLGHYAGSVPEGIADIVLHPRLRGIDAAEPYVADDEARAVEGVDDVAPAGAA